MKTLLLVSICAAILLGATEASSGQRDESPEPSADITKPKWIACAQERGESLGRCTYRIERDQKGKITMTAIFPNGFKRKLFFEGGKFLKANMTMSGVGTSFDWSLDDGTHMIRVDGQRYEVPDTLIAGN